MAGKHGDFAAALQIRQQTLRDLLLIAHRAGQLPREAKGPSVSPINPSGSGNAVLNYTWYVDVPDIELNAANGGLARIKLRLAGPLTILAKGVDGFKRQVRLNLTVDSSLIGVIEQLPSPPAVDAGPFDFLNAPAPNFDLRVTFTPVSVITSTLTVLTGQPLPQAWLDFFEGFAFRSGLGLTLSTMLTNVQSILPRRVAPILDALRIGNGSTAQVTGIVGSGIATLGIDVTNAAFGVATSGNPGAVGNFLDGTDIALIVDEAVHPLLGRALRHTINAKQSSADVTNVTVAFRSGHLKVSGHAEADAGSADFSFHITPRLGKPEKVEWYEDEYGEQYNEVTPATDEIWADLSNLKVDEDFAWWVILGLGVGYIFLAAFGPGGPGALAQLVHHVLIDAQVKMVKQVEGTDTGLMCHWQGTLPGTAQPNIQFGIESLTVFDDRIETRLTLKPEWPEDGTITGPNVGIWDIFDWSTFVLSPAWHHYDLADPEIRVRWQLRRTDTNEVVKEVEHLPGTSLNVSHTFTVRFASYGVGHTGLSAFKLSARVYRAGGGWPVDYWNTSRTVGIGDTLDRSHPYVHWHYQVPTPEVVVHNDGSTHQVGWRVTHRKSVLHRTHVPGRCRFAGSYSAEVKSVEYLDVLPFPLADLNANRDDVCDYCFYGGPDKTVPKVGQTKRFHPPPQG